MKRILTAMLALALAASMSVPALAENVETNNGYRATTADVKGWYEAGAEAPKSVIVDVVWEAESFTYTVNQKKEWNPGSHSYNNPAGQWTENSCGFTVTNHSNVDIEASFGFESDVEGLSGKFTKEKVELPTIKDSGATTPHTDTVNFSVTNGSIEKTEKIGTITVTVAIPVVAEVATEAELGAALSSVGKIRLANGIALTNKLLLSSAVKSGCVIDLNGHTLSCATDTAVYALGCDVTFKNGAIASAGSENFVIRADAQSHIKLENCTLNAGGNVAVQLVAGTVHLTDCTIDCDTPYSPIVLTTAYEIGSDLTVSGHTTIRTQSSSMFTKDDTSTVRCTAGTYNFDPTAYVDTDAYTVTGSADVWTVAAK